ncbi:phosphonate metabolism protein/1,5-bisphosphokinase (PRPP-forming) PhnN [Rhizobium leguminosarum]|nr:phosphonate metabolism protein/1,5-bisphosphokinase (PRPP-forming) PhnN [Rhizobium leguminosarum]
MTPVFPCGRLLLIVGPSGAGKDRLIDHAKRALSGKDRVRFVQRVITRPLSAGEVHAPMEVTDFKNSAGNGAFALHWAAHGLHYGIPTHIDDWLRAGDVVVANGSRAMLASARQRYPQVRIVNVTAPMDILAERLVARGRESLEDVRERLNRGEQHPVEGADVIHIDNSGQLSVAGDLLANLLAEEHHRCGKLKWFV